ncbi:DUF4352 domain-containing protein [Tissierella sp.]|uniref:DUF4352 domain-containing protein n=1 Tax=Tissierella sp. TaxID=41274 RepID=UPI0030716058
MEGKKKKPFFKRWWFWAIVLIIGIGMLGSNEGDKNKGDKSSEPDKIVVNQDDDKKEDDKKDVEPEEIVYQIGDSFTSGNLGIVVEEVEEKREFKSDNQFIKAVTTEGKFIVITAKLTNNDTKARTFSSMQFKIIDDQDREFDAYTDANLMMILGDKDIFLKECNPGMSRTGVFVFEVPEDIESYSLKVFSGVGFAAKTSEIVKLK